MTACKVERVLSYVAVPVWSVLDMLTWQGEWNNKKLYFENSTYKYYVRKHMQVLKIQKRLTKNISA